MKKKKKKKKKKSPITLMQFLFMHMKGTDIHLCHTEESINSLRNKYLVVSSYFAIKAERNEKILLYAFLFCRVFMKENIMDRVKKKRKLFVYMCI